MSAPGMPLTVLNAERESVGRSRCGPWRAAAERSVQMMMMMMIYPTLRKVCADDTVYAVGRASLDTGG